MASILETRSLQKRFGGLQAVANVDFEIDDGELHCLIGPNGAGKSTLFKLILGRYPPTAGTIRFRGEDITHVRSYDRVRRGMSIKMQVPGIFKDLSVRQRTWRSRCRIIAGRHGSRPRSTVWRSSSI